MHVRNSRQHQDIRRPVAAGPISAGSFPAEELRVPAGAGRSGSARPPLRREGGPLAHQCRQLVELVKGRRHAAPRQPGHRPLLLRIRRSRA